MYYWMYQCWTAMYRYVPVCTGIYRDIPIVVFTGMCGYVIFPKSTYEYVPVCTFQRKYIPTCNIASYKSVHTGIHRYILTYTRCRGFQMLPARRSPHCQAASLGLGGLSRRVRACPDISKLGTTYPTYENKHLLSILMIYLWFTYGQVLHVVKKVTYDLLILLILLMNRWWKSILLRILMIYFRINYNLLMIYYNFLIFYLSFTFLKSKS